MVWVFYGIMILGVSIIYTKYQEQPEEGLFLKLLGYSMLGAFQFKLQGYSLPLGFVAYGFLFRPTTNITTKKWAATLGLGLFFLGILIPVAERSYFERIREVDTTSRNLNIAKLSQDWIKIKNELNIQGDIRLENFDMEYKKDGRIKTLMYEVTTNYEGKYVHYSVTFSPEKSQYLVRAIKVEHWVQYLRLIQVDRFFEVYNKLDLASLKDMKNSDFYRIRCDGQSEYYGIKETKNFLLEGDKFVPLSQKQIPIQGFYIMAIGMYDDSQGYAQGSYQGAYNKCFIFEY